jgi:hypothetical protein
VDRRVIEQKLETLRYCVNRVAGRCPENAGALARDPDSQDIIALNLSRAVQQCVDIGAHLITSLDLPPPGTMGETFDRLAEGKVIDGALADRLTFGVVRPRPSARPPRPLQEVRRVNVDFPAWMVESLDREARRLGVTRQSLGGEIIERAILGSKMGSQAIHGFGIGSDELRLEQQETNSKRVLQTLAILPRRVLIPRGKKGNNGDRFINLSPLLPFFRAGYLPPGRPAATGAA